MEVSGATRSGRELLVLSKPGQQKNLHHGASVSLDHHRLKDSRRSPGRQTGSRDRVRICWVLLGSGWFWLVLPGSGVLPGGDLCPAQGRGPVFTDKQSQVAV